MRTSLFVSMLTAGGLALGGLAGFSTPPQMVERPGTDWRDSLGSRGSYYAPAAPSYTISMPDDPAPYGYRDAPPIFVAAAAIPLASSPVADTVTAEPAVRVHRGGAAEPMALYAPDDPGARPAELTVLSAAPPADAPAQAAETAAVAAPAEPTV